MTLQDKAIGLTSYIFPGTSSSLYELQPATNNRVLASGNGIIYSGNGGNGFVLLDSNANSLDTFQFKPTLFFSAGGRQGSFQPRFPNFLVLPTGSVIAGGEFRFQGFVYVRGNQFTSLAKLSAASRYAVDTAILYLGPDSADAFTASPSLHALSYNYNDHRLYYANANKAGPTGALIRRITSA